MRVLPRASCGSLWCVAVADLSWGTSPASQGASHPSRVRDPGKAAEAGPRAPSGGCVCSPGRRLAVSPVLSLALGQRRAGLGELGSVPGRVRKSPRAGSSLVRGAGPGLPRRPAADRPGSMLAVGLRARCGSGQPLRVVACQPREASQARFLTPPSRPGHIPGIWPVCPQLGSDTALPWGQGRHGPVSKGGVRQPLTFCFIFELASRVSGWSVHRLAPLACLAATPPPPSPRRPAPPAGRRAVHPGRPACPHARGLLQETQWQARAGLVHRA